VRAKVLNITNFQAHKSLKVPLSFPIITIKGESDQGKSAILRALRFLCLNDLSGHDFITHGKKECSIALELKSGEIITRTKSKSENVYALGEKEFRNFSGGVPEPIAKLLGVSEINFQSQHDSPFWLSDTAGEVSRQLNAVIDLSVIDSALSNIAMDVRRANESIQTAEEKLSQDKRDLEAMAGSEARIQEFAKLEELSNIVDKRTRRVKNLRRIIDEIRENKAEILQEQAVEKGALLVVAREAYRQGVRVIELSSLIDEIKTAQAQAKAPPDFSDVESKWEKVQKFNDRYYGLKALLDNRILTALRHLKIQESVLKTYEEEFHEKVRGKACPICGNKIKS
jgi:recombinational DNA repair ATPase RecF